MEKAPEAFRTISEVADDLDVPQHVLRFWESRFSHIRPMKRAGGRRYYRAEDVDLLRGIRQLLYGEGYTIRGVQRILKGERGRFGLWPAMGAQESEDGGGEDDESSGSDDQVPHMRLGPPPKAAAPPGLGPEDTKRLRMTLDRLVECKRLLEATLASRG